MTSPAAIFCVRSCSSLRIDILPLGYPIETNRTIPLPAGLLFLPAAAIVDLMHSINTLRKELGLATTNQVRNRIEAIKDLLHPHTRRGPNNQILLTDEGLDLLRRLQELYDSGLTISEASGVMRADSLSKPHTKIPVSSGLPSYGAKPPKTPERQILGNDIATLREAILSLESLVRSQAASPTQPAEPWWAALREEIDAP